MREKVIVFYLACINNERGKIYSLFRSLFFILSRFYYLAIKLRWLIYKLGVLPRAKLPCTTISVGNITWGGTGKTPAVIMIAKVLREMGKRVAVLSRGYGRSKKKDNKNKISIVSDGKRLILSSREAGDEPYLLARNLPDVPIIVGKNRIYSGKHAIEEFASEVVVLDDGFQYWPLNRDIDIVTIDCLNPYGNGYLIPRGSLREPISHLSRADVFLLTRANFVSRDDLQRITGDLGRLNPQSTILESIHRPKYLQGTFSGEKKNLDFIKDRKVVTFSSIGNPYSFEKTLEELGAKTVKIFRFPDHHDYERNDLREIETVCRTELEKGEVIAVTTEKDGVRLERVIFSESDRVLWEIWILKIELEIIRGKEEWQRKIESSV
ncbi:MAG: tetraacyldisaccharide 4'-kinase [Elusimicrobiota bacterium]|nr:tetraacyldisaccharide 4'-kinase [Elusimicrobiota bacterium]